MMQISQNRPLLIVEGGVCHEGSLTVAKEMMYAAKEAGAEIFKWQLFDTFSFLADTHILYSKRKALLDVMNAYDDLMDYGRSLGLHVGFSIFTENFYPVYGKADFIKIAARQLSDPIAFKTLGTHIKKCGAKKPIFCSYRMGQDVTALKESELRPYFMGVLSKYPHSLEEGKEVIDQTAKDYAGDIWGYSSHCPDVAVIDYALKKGASIIEAHFTLDHNFSKFRDHIVGFDPSELSLVMKRILSNTC